MTLQTRQTMQLSIPEGMIDLGVGQPSVSLLPLEIIKQAADHRLKQADPSFLAYGKESGCGCFRAVLAEFLTDGYQIPVDADDLFITCGATNSLDLICTFFARPGDTIFVEEPTYFLALRIFQARLLNVVSIPADENGLIIEALEEQLTHHSPAFVYSIPTFHNPSGATLPADRREKLVRLGEKHQFFIVADEVYQLLAYTSSPPPPMMAFDRQGTVLSVSSFTKILAPGLRLGWIQASPKLISRLTQSGLLASSGGLNPFTSAMVRSVIELGLLGKHLDFLKNTYTERARALSNALHEYLSDIFQFREPEGGFFIWGHLQGKIDTEHIRQQALKHQVHFQPGHRFSATESLKNHLRLSFSYYDAEALEEGVRRLKAVITGC
ncbi:MAG: PLP-dependent aminotransferase family protein [Desulfobacterales bacterium]|nr:PLP-dependent aminotransferase family protein [Desulfobacterales bacterium]MDD4073228.1 PLP-dependent aminotransferase family protein [Desulfobacterales bacterium]MDD4393607.1 PLP-dependent aminotransferase family protein [Desulfobacterales bacterium]